MKKIFSLVLYIGLFNLHALATISGTSYQMTLKTNVSLVTGTKSTIIGSNTSNTVSSAVALPFSFKLDGVSYSHMIACSNGWVKLGTSSSMTAIANSSNDVTHGSDKPKIAPFWERMNIPNSTGQGVHTITNGSTPNRTFIVEWNVAIPRLGSGRGSFQMVLYEGSNQIQYIYSGINGSNFFESYTIGLSGTDVKSESDFASVTTDSKGEHTVSYSKVDNSNNQTLSNNSSILFTPKTTSNSSSASFSNITATTFKCNFTKGNGNGRLIVGRLSTTKAIAPTNHTVYTANSTFGNGTSLGTGVYVVGSGDINTETITGLSPNSKYCLDIYEYNGNISGATAVFNTSSYLACQQTNNVYPTIGATLANLTNISSNSMTLNWTNGNGNKRIVVVSKTKILKTEISDKVTYTGNSTYGLGDDIGEAYVVYNGTGNSVNITGLINLSTYYFHIYEYNTFSSIDYYAIDLKLITKETTPISTPTIGASNLYFSAIGQSNLKLNWTNGNGSKRLVIAVKDAKLNQSPIDETNYMASSVFGSGESLGMGFVVYDGNDSSLNVTGLESATDYYFTVIEYNISNDLKYYANTLSKTINWNTTSSDSDKDGVNDLEDEYPNDEFKAYNTQFPGKGFGTLMFEDLWPGKGDYDFNDLVLDYRYNVVTNSSNDVVEVKYTFVTRAIGGALHNGFAFQLDGIASDRIISVTGSKAGGATWAAFNANGTEAGQKTTNILVFKDAYDLLAVSGGYSFVNVDPKAPNVGTDTTTLLVKFLENNNSPVKINTNLDEFTSKIFNPYLIVGQDRGKEIHLPNRTPSEMVNAKYFGMYQDDSNPSDGRFYKTKDELPWALNVTQSIPYTMEKIDFTEGYLNFSPWATSGGANNADWYLDREKNRDNSKLYIK